MWLAQAIRPATDLLRLLVSVFEWVAGRWKLWTGSGPTSQEPVKRARSVASPAALGSLAMPGLDSFEHGDFIEFI